MERPMVGLPMSSRTRGRQLVRAQEGEEGGEERGVREPVSKERRMTGHACAAGCGHFCWAAVGQWSEDQEDQTS